MDIGYVVMTLLTGQYPVNGSYAQRIATSSLVLSSIICLGIIIGKLVWSHWLVHIFYKVEKSETIIELTPRGRIMLEHLTGRISSLEAALLEVMEMIRAFGRWIGKFLLVASAVTIAVMGNECTFTERELSEFMKWPNSPEAQAIAKSMGPYPPN